jgi:hypothetical protein
LEDNVFQEELYLWKDEKEISLDNTHEKIRYKSCGSYHEETQ